MSGSTLGSLQRIVRQAVCITNPDPDLLGSLVLIPEVSFPPDLFAVVADDGDAAASNDDDDDDDDGYPFAHPSASSNLYNSRGFESEEEDGDESSDVDQVGRVQTQANEVMSGSMQSIVDGLMEWGDQYDSADDISLPSGMAVSMMLEEAGMVGKPSLSDDGFDPDLLG